MIQVLTIDPSPQTLGIQGHPKEFRLQKTEVPNGRGYWMWMMLHQPASILHVEGDDGPGESERDGDSQFFMFGKLREQWENPENVYIDVCLRSFCKL